jgi:hypothetical protein
VVPTPSLVLYGKTFFIFPPQSIKSLSIGLFARSTQQTTDVMNVWLDVLATKFPVRCPALIIFKKIDSVFILRRSL